MSHKLVSLYIGDGEYYTRTDVDNVIAELDESHKKEVGQLLMEIVGLKNRIAPKQSDKTLQERLNEVCEKHGVSTLQDLDWAFCECEKRNTKDRIEADNVIAEKDAKILALDAEVFKQKHHAKLFFDERNYAETQLRHQKYKRCLAMRNMCRYAQYSYSYLMENESSKILPNNIDFRRYNKKYHFYIRWRKRWMELAKQFKEEN